ncbi:MAG: DnaB-like helicase C-terminal domain-containing protein [Armatimonadota bacterium]|nr:DnaB-like helicase C-terminal domain-containing protein [Armatimonadota bacterium]MDR7450028.1 DnaB-like helicase C-terminal domain-containing protein [Armatimonadota bacterium]MDR7459048.1 DnaB-like helicase C-terminal domain-containing protein [Armatimonadota bacterium]MDR7480148.1 DnaB-like helicase C-terminal domain-containing protein [Armatimonadota bacterium]MDR7488875.1 DnaB-like helicase C-terminal domain-containing protein [Armatimonadota bacterium]
MTGDEEIEDRGTAGLGDVMEYHRIETALLSGLIRDRQLYVLALNQGFHADQLSHSAGKRLLKAVAELYGAGRPVDDLTVRAYLEDQGLYSEDMARYLATVLAQRPPTAGQLVAYLEILRARESRELLLRLHEELGAFIHRGSDAHQDIVAFTTEAIRQLLDIQKRRLRRQVLPVAEAVGSLVDDAERRGGGQLGYSIYPFERLNALLSGLRKGFYYGLAGAPRRGKTNFALELATYVAANHRVPVLYYTWEQTRRVLAARLLAREVGINPTLILSGVDPAGRSLASRLREAQTMVSAYAPFLFVVEAGRRETLDRIRAHAYNLMQEFETNEVVIFFDYLQKIPTREYVDDPRARTDAISTALAEMSLELNCPIFAISPLDKEGCRLDEKPADESQETDLYHRPTMHHSMGSGDLEYDLDVAMVLAKDWKATHDLHQLLESKARAEGLDPQAMPRVDIVNLFVDKNRDAPEAASYIVQYAFFVTLNKFIELDYKLEKEYRPDFHGFTKIQDIYGYLRQQGYIPTREPGTPAPALASLGGVAVPRAASGGGPGAASAASIG